MKYYLIQSMLLLFIGILFSCNGGESSSDKGNGTTSTCGTKNQLGNLTYNGIKQDFKVTDVYANYNSMYKSYRVLYLNYPKAEDSDRGKKEAGQIRLVVGLFNPIDGVFKPGTYTLEGDENGYNKASVQVETESGLKMCNIQGVEETGSIEILDVSKSSICGKFNLMGVNFQASGEFNTKHEAVPTPPKK